MKVNLKNINVWLQGIDNAEQLSLWAENKLTLPEEFTAPKPSYYPKAQLRRLSPFSKVALHCLDMPQALEQNLPLVFASQHGDLAKTVKLIKDAALGEDLSPTQFALSVHNATTGLFGIASKNTAETTTISAGANSFLEGLIEASMQCQQSKSAVIYCYCDFDVPEEYRQYESVKPARCITLIISSTTSDADLVSIDVSLTSNEASSSSNEDLSTEFIKHYYLQSDKVMQSKNYAIKLGFH